MKSAAARGGSSMGVRIQKVYMWRRSSCLHAAQRSSVCVMSDLVFSRRSFPSVQRRASLHSSPRSRDGGHGLQRSFRKCGSRQPLQSRVSRQPVGHGSLRGRPNPHCAAAACFARRPARAQHAAHLHTEETRGCVQAQQMVPAQDIPKCE